MTDDTDWDAVWATYEGVIQEEPELEPGEFGSLPAAALDRRNLRAAKDTYAGSDPAAVDWSQVTGTKSLVRWTDEAGDREITETVAKPLLGIVDLMQQTAELNARWKDTDTDD